MRRVPASATLAGTCIYSHFHVECWKSFKANRKCVAAHSSRWNWRVCESSCQYIVAAAPSMRFDDHTSLGGEKRSFEDTPWTAIDKLKVGGYANIGATTDDVLKPYWKPVYFYLRRKGYANEEAKDLTQGFFYEIVLGQRLFQQADRAKGRFRTFLLTALDRYLVSAHRKETAKKRMPKDGLVRLDDLGVIELPEAISEFSPEESFRYAWLAELLDRMLADIEAECRARDMKVHWQLFYTRVVRPIMEAKPPPSMTNICDQYGIEDTRQASKMIYTVKRRFRAAIKEYVRQSVSSEDEVDEEIYEMLRLFGEEPRY